MNETDATEILLAEDDPHDAEMTLRALRKHNVSNQIHWVKDGEEALHFLQRTGPYADRAGRDPRLVLLDIKMPKVTGIEVLRALKSDPLLQKIPVVIMTSSHEERDLTESYRLGVNSYVVKPVEFSAFMKAVTEVGLYWMLHNRTPG